jgi:hypothetical protein
MVFAVSPSSSEASATTRSNVRNRRSFAGLGAGYHWGAALMRA